MNISVCVGSSCHLKGSYRIIELATAFIKKHKLEDKVTLKAAFCLGHCAEGANIKIDDEIVSGVNEDNFEKIFEEKVLAVLSAEKGEQVD